MVFESSIREEISAWIILVIGLPLSLPPRLLLFPTPSSSPHDQ